MSEITTVGLDLAKGVRRHCGYPGEKGEKGARLDFRHAYALMTDHVRFLELEPGPFRSAFERTPTPR